MTVLQIEIDVTGAKTMLDRVEHGAGESVVDLFRRLGPTLKNELRRRIPKKTGLARSAIFSRMEATRSQEIVLLVGGDLVIAPHLVYIEHGRKGKRLFGNPGPVKAFEERNRERIHKEIEEAVGAAVRTAARNG